MDGPVIADEPSPYVRTFPSSDGTRIGVSSSGHGPVVVLVHGAATDASSWSAVVEALAARHRCVVMDRRGRGRSEDGDAYALELEFDDVAEILTQQGDCVTLVGHSFGAICAIGAAARTEALHSLVLYEPPLPLEGPIHALTIDRFAELIAARRFEDALVLGLRDVVRISPAEERVLRASDVWPRMVSSAPLWLREMRAVDALAVSPLPLDVDAPTTLILGSETAPHHRAASDALRDLGANVAVLDGVGHMGNLTEPEVVAAVVERAACTCTRDLPGSS